MQCNQMIPNRTPTGRLATGKNAGKTRCEGKLEAATTVWLDITGGTIDSNGVVMIDAVTPAHVNDEYKGMALDLESRFVVSCEACGHDYAHDFSALFMTQVGLQPIGNTERVVGGPRGGLAEAIAANQDGDRYTVAPFGNVWEVLDGGASFDQEQGGRLLRRTEQQAQDEADRRNATD